MDSSLKFDHGSAENIYNNEKRIPYRLCYNDKIKVIPTRPVYEEKISNTTFQEQESRAVLPLAKVNSVDIIQTKIIHDANNIRNRRSVTSMERRTTPSLYLPYLLGNKPDADITPVFNTATYRGFRTQQDRKCFAFSRTLERDQKQLFDGKVDKRLATPAVIDISKPIQLQSRYTVIQRT